ncbi:MAG: type II secretion system protein N, partial [Caldimonas sp.]
MIRRKRNRQLWAPTVASTGWSESTLAEQAWVEARGAASRWAIAGVIVGALVGLLAFAPAAWLAQAVLSSTDGRLILSDARGTIWSGSAVPVLAGGPDSRAASYVPGRLEWTLSPRWYGLQLAARQDCCINGTMRAEIRPGL